MMGTLVAKRLKTPGRFNLIYIYGSQRVSFPLTPGILMEASPSILVVDYTRTNRLVNVNGLR